MTLHRHLAAGALTAGVLLAPPVQASYFKEAALDALYAAGQHAELDRLGQQRLAARPDDAQAVLAVAVAALQSDDAARRKAAIDKAEACVQRQAQAAACHYALGVVTGIQAASEGLLKVAGSVGRIRDSLTEALRLEPQWFAARSALMEFYLLAPGFIGGSTAKAAETARAAVTPEQSRVLQARIALQERRFDSVLQMLGDSTTSSDTALAGEARSWVAQAGFGYLNDGQGEKARPVFERLMRERADDPQGPYGLGRVHAEAGAHAQALKLYDHAARLKGAGSLPIDYRVGIAHQALGQADAARAAFGRYVAAGKGSKSSRDDARKRLEQLGG